VQVNVLPTFASWSSGQSTVSTCTEPGPSIDSRTLFSTASTSTVVAPHAATRKLDAMTKPSAAPLAMFMDAG
jgi:hypothetical protein